MRRLPAWLVALSAVALFALGEVVGGGSPVPGAAADSDPALVRAPLAFDAPAPARIATGHGQRLAEVSGRSIPAVALLAGLALVVARRHGPVEPRGHAGTPLFARRHSISLRAPPLLRVA